MYRRSSVLLLALGACMPDYAPVLICHNGNCAGTGQYGDDTIAGLQESLALRYTGRPMLDGIEVDTYLYWDGAQTHCLFAHDASNPLASATPREAAAIVAEYLQSDDVAWNRERFFLKIELKPTVAGREDFHTETQLGQHAECAMDLAIAATAGTRHDVTIIFDSVAECLHWSIYDRRDRPEWAPLFDNPRLEVAYSGPIVPERQCVRFKPDIRTFFVRAWRDTEIESLRPVMVWLDRHSENTETLKIIRHLRPEYVTTSAAPFVRGWIEGYK